MRPSGRRFRAAIGWLQPPPRIVDWSILVVVCTQVVTGLVSFTVGTPEWWPLFWVHRVLGFLLVPLLAFKLARVRHRLTVRRKWQRSTALSVLALVAVIGTLGTGIAWVFGLDVRLAYWTLLSVHVGFGLALLPIAIAHVLTRFRPPRRADFDRRRTSLQFAAGLLAGAATYRAQTAATRALGWAGADRRFTGSQARTGDGNDAFPITSWVADDPDPIDRETWQLRVRGAVSGPLVLDDGDLVGEGETGNDTGSAGAGAGTPDSAGAGAPDGADDGADDGTAASGRVQSDAAGTALRADAELEALLDCTSGWYTVQEWRGLRVGDLLDVVEPGDDAQYVRFVSVTGYRWSLPIDEARDALLATHVGGEPLDHGHGAPLRLVAPGRRGFQWVKWIERIDVRRRRDPAQWLVTLLSGFN